MPRTALHQVSTAIRHPALLRGGRRYHHGDLRRALIDAGVELARMGGPHAIVLRATSRQVGVSATAAYHHFANQKDLVAAVAQQCMSELSKSMIERKRHITARGPLQRAAAELEAIGRAYIDFARTEPGWFRTAFSAGRHHPADGPHESVNEYGREADSVSSPYEVLRAGIDALVEVSAVPHERRAGAEYAAWSAVHGLSELLLDGPLHELPESEVERAISMVLAAVCERLT